MDKEELHCRISTAFADVPYPRDDHIGSPDGRDDGEYVTEKLRGRSWQSLKPSELWDGALSFMTPEAFHYYFAAYLLVWDSEEAGDAGSAYFYHLTPPREVADGLLMPLFYENFRAFTPEQKKIISEFLDFVHEEIRGWWKDLGGLSRKQESEWLAVRDYWRKAAEGDDLGLSHEG